MNIVKQDIWQYLKTTKKPVVLYGMGNGADKIIKALFLNYRKCIFINKFK